MSEPSVIVPARLKIAVGIVSNQIHEYEKAKLQDCSVEYEVLKGNAISAGLEILSAVTGVLYVWSRRKMRDGKLYSGVCRIENGEVVDIYDNCAGVLEGGIVDGER